MKNTKTATADDLKRQQLKITIFHPFKRWNGGGGLCLTNENGWVLHSTTDKKEKVIKWLTSEVGMW